MSQPPFLTGLDVLLEDQRNLIQGRRIGLLTHAAALTVDGDWSAERLWRDPDVELVCLLGPEHGLFGQGGAGEVVASTTHPRWGIPIHSLYGDSRKPTPTMLEDIDVLIIDLQDLGVRCYTFISTLCLALEAAAECGKTAIVTDRPIPLPEVFDGPMLDPAFTSFVAEVPFPLVYGMTQGESARYLQQHFQWDLDLHILEMWGYRSNPRRQPGWPPFVPPSTGIRSWETAWCYPATVFTEALPTLDCGRTGPQPFQILGAPWFEGREVIDALSAYELPGITFHPHAYYIRHPDGSVGDFALPANPQAAGRANSPSEPRPQKGSRAESVWVEGLRLVVTDPNAFRPVTTGLVLLETLQERHGREHLWNTPDTRPDFFDQLCGTDTVRLGLESSLPVLTQADTWHDDCVAFLELRSSCLLYP